VRAEAEQPEAGKGDGFEVRVRWRGPLLVGMAILPAAVLVWVFGPFHGDEALAGVIPGCAVVGAFYWFQAFRLKAVGCVLRIDAAGVTVGDRTVPWGQLERVEAVRRRVVAFVPRIPGEGDLLPLVPTGSREGNADRRRRTQYWLAERYGSPMVVFTTLYGARVDEILEAVRLYSGGEPVSG
jgi:hypothetical protein